MSTCSITMQPTFEKKCLDLLSEKNFKEILERMSLDVETHNNLWFSHIGTVIAQSQGVKEVYMTGRYVKTIAGGKKEQLDCPRVDFDIRVTLTNRGYVTKNSHTGARLTLYHEKNFDFYRPIHLRDWIDKQLDNFKILKPNAEFLPQLKISLSKERKKDNNHLIFTAIVEENNKIKSFLTQFFLTQLLENKIVNNKKIKI